MPSDLTTPETEAPESIHIPAVHLTGSQSAGLICWDSEPTWKDGIEYVRADLHEAALSAARREAEEARERAERAEAAIAVAKYAAEAADEFARDLVRRMLVWIDQGSLSALSDSLGQALRADTPRGESNAG